MPKYSLCSLQSLTESNLPCPVYISYTKPINYGLGQLHNHKAASPKKEQGYGALSQWA